MGLLTVLRYTLILSHVIKELEAPLRPWVDRYHYPGHYTSTMTPFLNNTDQRIASEIPDFRMEEKHFTAFNDLFKEENRPYRISPHYKQTYRWQTVDQAYLLGCFCTTVFRKYITLAGCAVITTRHLLTTATPTDLILRNYKEELTMVGILGAWYDVDSNVFNSSLYTTPARIHHHPMYRYDYEVNVSHPIPAMYDLSLWAATYRFYGMEISISRAVICQRGIAGWFSYVPPMPLSTDLGIVVGFQFMKSYGRRPLPWYKYAVRTRDFVYPCPKSDWHWFNCVKGEYWGKYGFDSGGGYHLSLQGDYLRNDGMIGICAFSLKLRSVQTTHYFTVIDTYPVLDFLYDGMLGLSRYTWLDDRFEDSRWMAPMCTEYIPEVYHFGFEHNVGGVLPFY